MTKRRRRAKTVRSAQRRPSPSRHPIPSTREPRELREPRESLSDLLPRLAVLCAKLHVGFGVLAKHTHDPNLAGDASALASAHRTLADEIVDVALALGIETPRIKSTCGERLRWEWLASSARLTDGAPESQLIAECARLQREAADAGIDAAAPESSTPSAPSATAMRQIRIALDRARASGERLASRDEASHHANESRAFAFPGA